MAVLLVFLAAGVERSPSVVGDAGRLPAVWDGGSHEGVSISSGELTTAGARPAPAPRRLRIGKLELDAPIVPVRAAGQRVNLSERGRRVGWYRHGPAPGASVGTAVLLAHVRTPVGPGAFASLHRLGPGDGVHVLRDDGKTASFTVVARRRYRKDQLPVEQLFRGSGPAFLVLVTCGGTFDGSRGHYRDNVVILAQAT